MSDQNKKDPRSFLVPREAICLFVYGTSFSRTFIIIVGCLVLIDCSALFCLEGLGFFPAHVGSEVNPTAIASYEAF